MLFLPWLSSHPPSTGHRISKGWFCQQSFPREMGDAIPPGRSAHLPCLRFLHGDATVDNCREFLPRLIHPVDTARRFYELSWNSFGPELASNLSSPRGLSELLGSRMHPISCLEVKSDHTHHIIRAWNGPPYNKALPYLRLKEVHLSECSHLFAASVENTRDAVGRLKWDGLEGFNDRDEELEGAQSETSEDGMEHEEDECDNEQSEGDVDDQDSEDNNS